ncbi:hypothetical protein E4U22_007621 [Claviceps purpurea]|nr:hypothetical protein E4U12_006938 [Claviceps purpurea]KAG6172919.1 hypothetical protein E4U11_000011 [Claviceps purpurea]KAG6209510.1 hypothetical protein E4U34_007607 [Claviceps purpurea]KAG6214104.1 hypothetical protein E4U50_000644 [Claviceps purpurea]KAG6315756.1 hypothetical protein E4U22_007621 [Claviceps purpurea]
MESSALAWSLDRVEALILSLYESKAPDKIATDQTLLANFQCSPQAWILARELLQRPDEKVRFFGALTIIIKLNRESTSLSEENAKELLMNLTEWYLYSFGTSNSSLVPRKLASALATYFVYFHHLWPNFVRHLVVCLLSNQYYDPSRLNIPDETFTRLENVQTNSLRAVLWVITSVLEDVTKIDLNAVDNFGLYDTVVSQAPDVANIVAECLTHRRLSAIGDNALKCLQAWLIFAQKIASHDSQVVALFRELLPTVIALLPVDSQFESSAELLTEVLCGYPSLLTSQHLNLLADVFVSPWSDQWYTRLVQGDGSFDTAQFGHLILSFGEERLQWLMKSEDPRCQIILSKLCGLLTAKGLPAVEDKIFVPAIEFWSTFTETISDNFSPNDIAAAPWAEQAVRLVLEAISNAWQKIAYPSTEEISGWDQSDRANFSDARKDVIDLLQSTYSVCGARLITTFAELVLAALDKSAWLRLEAAAYCLAGLADCASDDGWLDEALRPVFDSSLFSRLDSSDSGIPHRTKQTCLYLIERYTEYFERNVFSLAPALRLLFSLLGDRYLAPSASKSIYQLCSSCRHHLHPETESFLTEFQRLVAGGQLDCISSEKVVNAIACVAQAIPDGDQRIHICSKLLNIVGDDVLRAKQLLNWPIDFKLPCSGQRCFDDSVSGERPAMHVALRALRYLLSVGRGFQSPTESAVDLETISSSFSKRDSRLTSLNRQVIAMLMDVESHFSENAEVAELSCTILRCGFAESEAGPFVLDMDTVTGYLTRHSGQVPRPGLFVATACSFVSSIHARGSAPEGVFAALFRWVIELLQALPEPEHDPELSQNCIEFASRLLIKSPKTLLAIQPPATAELFFLFSLQVLDGNEPLPKGASAEFWSNFIALKHGEQDIQDAAKQAMETLGPLVALSIARNVGGHASRSELERLSEPIKKLVHRYPMARQWLEAGLSHHSFPSDKITPEQKSLFVKKLVSLRGSRATNQVVRDFWLSARGSSFAYAS